ncbi:carboxypeptidase-like regulatory domain-containing protein [Variovorax sp. H27-G14]|uniref:carboxypeptidase-like regulatory domain-containing protein n=1 Tax=Variovorax sp. H27-G14 TaxID=3111914 RepID=UPI0038FC99A5
MAPVSGAQAQTTPPPSKNPAAAAPAPAVSDARIETIDRAQAEQARLKALIDAAPKAYEDRFMNPDTLATGEAVPEVEQPQGFRTWLVESRIGFGDASSTGYGRQRAAEFGQRFEYRRETLNYGEFVLQADARHLSGDNALGGGGIGSLGYARDATSGRFTLRNLGFALTTQTFADSAVGDIYSELTDGLARNYRLSLGSTTVRGASTRIFSSDLDVRAGFGQRGNLTGGPYPGFEQSQGTLGWLGLTKRLGERWFASLQLDQARDIPAYYLDPVTALGVGRKDVTSAATSIGYGSELLRDGDVKGRATLVSSRTSSTTSTIAPGNTATGSSQGLFLEASARTDAYRHELGAYAARPNLYFGDQPLATGTRGAYWRLDRSDNRLNWGAALDFERAAPSDNFSLFGYRRAGASGNFQYLVDRNTSFGGSLNLMQTRYDDSVAGPASQGSQGNRFRSLYANAFYQTRFFDWPRSRLNLSVRRNEAIVLGDGTATGQELQWEQDWIDGRFETMRPELTTTLGYARDQSSASVRHYPTAGVQFRAWVASGFSVTGNLRYTSQNGGLYTSRGLSGTLSAEKDLAPGWRAGVAANLNQARATTVPVALNEPSLFRTTDKTVYVYLRWEGSAGSAYQTAGARTGNAGSGSVTGRVFYDANSDGQPQIGEGGVANVEVLLDGRYRAMTDRDGRFEFPLVTTGRHQLTLTPETVPLPWGPARDAGASVDVPLRGQASTSIPVIKVGQ